MWKLRDKDKRNAYNYCGPNKTNFRDSAGRPYSTIYYRELYEEYERRDDSSDTGWPDTEHGAMWMNEAEEKAGMHDFLRATRGVRYKPGDQVSALDLYNWQTVGIDREMAFMHEAVYMEGQPSEEIPLKYEGCDYDWREDIEYLPIAETRVDHYLNESTPDK